MITRTGAPCSCEQRGAVHLVGEHHVGQLGLIEREVVVVRDLRGDEVCGVGVRERLGEREQILEAHARPMDVADGPAGDAVERGDLLGPRQRQQLLVVDLDRCADEPVDLAVARSRGSNVGIVAATV